eukprot:COSAG06_NODE_24308_length_666_cov_1.458554_1_plen_20_part_10
MHRGWVVMGYSSYHVRVVAG